MAEQMKQLVFVGGKKYIQLLHEDGRVELEEVPVKPPKPSG